MVYTTRDQILETLKKDYKIPNEFYFHFRDESEILLCKFEKKISTNFYIYKSNNKLKSIITPGDLLYALNTKLIEIIDKGGNLYV